MQNILVLDKSGSPMRWASVEEGIVHVAKQQVVWDYGTHEFVLHGGISRSSGVQSELSVKSIIAVDGVIKHSQKYMNVVSRRKLFSRDLHICAYCGGHFDYSELSMDHVTPSSRGGLNTWTNLVTACISCNQKKNDKTPEEARMPLMYVPYVPNRYEAMILANRRILCDQMEFLLAGVPKHSRLLS